MSTARLPPVRCSSCGRVLAPLLSTIDDLFCEIYDAEQRAAYAAGETEYDDDAEDRLLSWHERIKVKVMNAILQDRPDAESRRMQALYDVPKLPAFAMCCRVKIAAYVQAERAPDADEDSLDETCRYIPGIAFKTASVAGPRVYRVGDM